MTACVQRKREGQIVKSSVSHQRHFLEEGGEAGHRRVWRGGLVFLLETVSWEK